MKKYEIISHTADIRLQVSGNTPRELFLGALLGMSQILKKNSCLETKQLPVKIETSVSSVDQTSLLIDFLNEVLAMSFENMAVFCKIQFRVIGEKSLDAILEGMLIKEFDEDIKAVTYHEAEIIKNREGNLETMIIFDI